MSAVVTSPERAPSRTPVLLRRLLVALLALALLTGGTALLLTWAEHAVVTEAGEHTATAVTQAYAADEALADADSQAVQTIPDGDGPSGQYQADIAAAEQSLEQAAENNTAGLPGSQPLALIEGLLPAYTSMVEQADTQYGTPPPARGKGSDVGVEYLWSASELMHQQILSGPGGPPCPDSQEGQNSLACLEQAEQQALASQRSSPWANPWLNGLWIAFAVALLAVLAATQYLLYRRSHRVLGVFLTLAAAAVIALGVSASHLFASQHAFDAAAGRLATVVTLENSETAARDGQGQAALAAEVSGACNACTAEEAEASQQVQADAQAQRQAGAAVTAACGTPAVSAGCVTREESDYTADVLTAEAGYGVSMALTGVLAAALLLLIPLGLRRPLDEYRYTQT